MLPSAASYHGTAPRASGRARFRQVGAGRLPACRGRSRYTKNKVKAAGVKRQLSVEAIDAFLAHFTPDDRAYLVMLVANTTGIADAERRTDTAITAATVAVQKARRSAVVLAFSTAVSLLAGAATAWYASCLGGRYRDNVPPRYGALRNAPRRQARYEKFLLIGIGISGTENCPDTTRVLLTGGPRGLPHARPSQARKVDVSQKSPCDRRRASLIVVFPSNPPPFTFPGAAKRCEGGELDGNEACRATIPAAVASWSSLPLVAVRSIFMSIIRRTARLLERAPHTGGLHSLGGGARRDEPP
jgi:hypothetical protein